jgi:hypothetical protein
LFSFNNMIIIARKRKRLVFFCTKLDG